MLSFALPSILKRGASVPEETKAKTPAAITATLPALIAALI
jgi:hypothetical protein